ncbi:MULTISPECIES: hypothetical protein [unclassified Lysinibacillus]|uniref:hypothetical protein n=1 Tax=unclassified Lysinibacillus TaxID=2636778 RepID=UPI002554BE02|nr:MULTISPECIES: hypothetical protein [unclassified Lysinibacillus]MDM5246742.1 hypothetical protein [Lysinibacillus sp. G4S2]
MGAILGILLAIHDAIGGSHVAISGSRLFISDFLVVISDSQLFISDFLVVISDSQLVSVASLSRKKHLLA